MKERMGKKIKALRELFGMTQGELAKALEVSKEFVSMVENGKRLPSLETISRLGKVFHKDADYFMKEEEEPFAALFRVECLDPLVRRELTKATKFASDYAFLEKEAEQEAAIMPDYSRKYAVRGRSFAALTAGAESLAEEEAGRLGLGSEPIADIFGLMESQGVRVIRQQMGDIKFDGVFLFSQESGAFVIINASHNMGRQVFTAAHEYCHCLKDRDLGVQVDMDIFEAYGAGAVSNLDRFANMFAAAFLMPRSAIDKVLRGVPYIGPEEVIHLKRYFKVSYQAMVWRLFNLKRISKDRKEEFMGMKPSALEKAIFGDTGEKLEPPRVPDRYFRLALEAYFKDKVTTSKLAELLDVDVFTLRAALSESGIKAGRRAVEERTA